MALEQMEGFELAGRTVRKALFLCEKCSQSKFSFVSILFMKREPLNTLNKTPWMKQAVRKTLFLLPARY